MIKPVPELEMNQFIFQLPLYDIITIKRENLTAVHQQLDFTTLKCDGFNPSLNERTSYDIEIPFFYRHGAKYTPAAYLRLGGTVTLELHCVRTKEVFCVIIHGWFKSGNGFIKDIDGFDSIDYTDPKNDDNEMYIMKIGQYPALADFHKKDYKKYRKVIDDSKLQELTKAIGLISHGIGIGSFVYLRRIFESLIQEAYEKAGNTIRPEDFEKARMPEKIDMLKNYLPDFLVKNKSIYGILSTGIHELSEEECKKHFPVVKTAIELILDEKLEKHNRDLKTKEIESEISKITSQIKNQG